MRRPVQAVRTRQRSQDDQVGVARIKARVIVGRARHGNGEEERASVAPRAPNLENDGIDELGSRRWGQAHHLAASRAALPLLSEVWRETREHPEPADRAEQLPISLHHSPHPPSQAPRTSRAIRLDRVRPWHVRMALAFSNCPGPPSWVRAGVNATNL